MQCVTIMITVSKKVTQAVLITIVIVVLYPASQSCLLLAGITCHVTCLLESTTFAPVHGAYQRKAEILNPGFCSLKTGSQPSKDWPTPLAEAAVPGRWPDCSAIQVAQVCVVGSSWFFNACSR